jgi:hypothetical protein
MSDITHIELSNEVYECLTTNTTHLARIAVALEVIASDITERRERERRELISEYVRLDHARADSARRFDEAEAALAERSTEHRVKQANYWHEEIGRYSELIERFSIRHPEIVAAVHQETAGES